MRSLHYRLDVESPLVMTAASATEGGHESLSRVPGAALLGATAARGGYPAAGELSWNLFHSGRVSFGDAHPVDEGGASGVPVPACVEVPKGSRPDSLADGRWFNTLRQRGPIPAGTPPRVVLAKGGGVLFPSGQLGRARKHYALKTAIDPETGRAKEGALFGYEAIAAGTRLGFSVAVDLDGAEADRMERFLDEHLVGPVGLGRSRGAEFGRARITKIEVPPAGLPLAEPAQEGGRVRLTLLLVSDAAWTTPLGEPAAQPRPEVFGLPPGSALVRSHCSLGHRRWTPFNGHRLQPDSERVVAKAGGVVTFDVPADAWDPTGLAQLRERGTIGVSAHRAEGLGRFLVHPRLLTDAEGAEGVFGPPPAPVEKPVLPTALPEGILGRWLQRRHDDAKLDAASYKAAREAFDGSFRRLAERPKSPSSSQWQAVRAEAKKALLLDGLRIEDLLEAMMVEGVARHAWGQIDKANTPAEMLLGAIARCSELGESDRFKALFTMHLAQLTARKRQAVTRNGEGRRHD